MRAICTLVLAVSISGCAVEKSQATDASEREIGETSTATVNSDERAALAAGSELKQPVTEEQLLSCELVAGMTPHCGYQNPEDLVHIPGTQLLIVSEMGEFMADSPGALSLLNMSTGQRETLSIDWSQPEQFWGDRTCPEPDVEALSPHGIDLTIRDSGEIALLVVNHGKRESIEFFEVALSGDLSWKGCALPPEDPFINDVAARRDGGFYATHMWNKSDSFEATVETLLSGNPTGWVWAWTIEDGFSRLANSDDLMPNGIAINDTNDTLYVNVYIGNKTFAYDLGSNERIGEVELRQPDNVSVDASGDVWIASHQHDPIGQACTLVDRGPCLLPFQVIKLDPDTLASEVVVDHDGEPMGYATVALRVGDRIFLGTAHGDRIVSIEI